MNPVFVGFFVFFRTVTMSMAFAKFVKRKGEMNPLMFANRTKYGP